MRYPEVVTRSEWEAARTSLLAKEREATHARDALNAERRRMPMVEVPTDYKFASPAGELSFPDLFEGRPQLVVYHNMLMPGSNEPCQGCSLFGDGIGGSLAHVNARRTTFAMVSRARVSEIEGVKARLGWNFPWYSCYDTTFHDDFVTSQNARFGLSVFLHRDDRIFQTYFTTQRGVEYVGNTFSLLDVTPFGRQETWEDSPEGWPQEPTHSWERLNDEYDA
ncbi:DUF899 domain-containing protein [Streptosporangium carneum]|uniref:DUF899 domain-containing protein n=1 Tax=Streptosporangium carneum TaxID=47481 RepID=A0A9W6I483_9ACTN|nr:DUF899 domain-containing protein [Streptosporangium carneum]GLK11388.1 hypothetical protein GCM10017600_47950 [Streptosporangium carneum]